MKLYVKIVAFSEEDGVKSTREELIDIPAKVVKLNEVIMGDDVSGLLEGFATSALVGALGTVQIGGPNKANQILSGTGGGPIGGSAPESGEDQTAHAGLAGALGLDIIEAMDQRDANAHGPAYPRGAAPPPRTAPQPQMGPGPIGFGPHRGR